MKVTYNGARHTLRDKDLLGEGGEARVYAMGRDLAAKIYTLADTERAERIARITAFPSNLPAGVVAPLGIIEGAREAPVGFAMERFDGRAIRWLGRRAWREGLLSRASVCRVFTELHTLLSALHAAGVVVGDLNSGNVLFKDEDVRIIDADSMQLAGWPCPVADERILDPALYGVDLAAAPAFSPDTDWYAFSTLLFESLLYVHPYGGVKKGMKSLLERAQAGHSVLRSDVKRPKAAADPELLPEALLDWFERVFDRGARGAFPPDLLALAWTACACGAEHGQSACPACARPVKRAPAVRRGRATARRVTRVGGRIAAARVSAEGELSYLWEEGGALRREDSSLVIAGALSPELGVHIAGRHTWLTRGGEALKLRDGQVSARVRTGLCRGETAFAAGAASAYLLRGDWLIEEANGQPLGQVLEGQTWIAVGDALGFGAWRVGRLLMAFTFTPGRPGFTPVTLPPVDGRVLDRSVAFDGADVLLGLETEHQGRRRSALHLIRGGAVVASREGEPDLDPALHTVRGRALRRGRVVLATDDGLLVLAPRGDRLVDIAAFPDVEPFVDAETALLPGSGGSLFAVTPREITHITLT